MQAGYIRRGLIGLSATAVLGVGVLLFGCGSNEEIRIPEYSNSNFYSFVEKTLVFPGDNRPTAGILVYKADGKTILEVRELRAYIEMDEEAYKRYEEPRLLKEGIDAICTVGKRVECRTESGDTSDYNLVVRRRDTTIIQLFKFGRPYQVCIEGEVCYIDSKLNGTLDTKVDSDTIYRIKDGEVVEFR